MKRTIYLAAILLITALACSSSMGTSEGGEIKMDAAGFSADIPAGYETSSFFGELGATKENTDTYEGPNFTVVLNPPSIYNTPDAVLDNIQGGDNIFNYIYSGSRTPVTFNGVSGLAEDFSGVTEETKVSIAGRVTVGILPDGRQFRFFGHWPEDQTAEMLPVYESILNSVKFYEPVPATATP